MNCFYQLCCVLKGGKSEGGRGESIAVASPFPQPQQGQTGPGPHELCTLFMVLPKCSLKKLYFNKMDECQIKQIYTLHK